MAITAINARNQIVGKVKQVRRGDVVSEVVVDAGSITITSIVSTTSIDELGIKTGSEVIALFKSTTVALASFSPT